jgi:hypothetical protein
MSRFGKYILPAILCIFSASPVLGADPNVRRPTEPVRYQIVDVDAANNLVTIRSQSGTTKQIVVESAAKIQKGMNAICEEDCGRSILIGTTRIHVVRSVNTRAQ